MHYIAAAFVLLTFPAFVAWITRYPRQRRWAYLGLGLLPFTVSHWNLDGALITWATWPGYVKGMILTALDTLALAIIVTHRKPRGLPPLSVYLIAYLLAATLSIAFSDIALGSFFYSFQLLRILIVTIAVAKIAPDPKALNWLATGLALGICYQAGFATWQKFNGVFQAAGTMGHQNLLGMMSHFALFPLLAMLLGGYRNKLAILGVVASLAVIAFGASRATIGLGLLGITLLLLLSLIRRSTAKKWRIVGTATLAVALVAPFMLQAIQTRLGQLAQDDAGGYDERAAFERAAKMIWTDYPMGIGANQYVIIANTKGYSARAGVIWNETSRAANVHNTYLLVAAETGWPGLLTLIALFVGPALAGLRFAFQDRRDPRGEIVLGCVVATVICGIHDLYEWIWVRYEVQYLFGISIGIMGGMIRARATEKRRRRRKPVAAAADPTDPQTVLALTPLPERA